MSKIKVILWDLDGTLLNFRPAEKAAITNTFQEFNLGELTDELVKQYSIINQKHWDLLELGKITKPEVLTGRFKEFFTLLDIDTSIVHDFNARYQVNLGSNVFPYPHALENIALFKNNGIKQYAVTNGTKVSQTLKLKNSGLDKLFDGIFISEDVGAEKPKIEFFNKVFEHIGDYQLDEIIIIGDSLTGDMRGGNNAGILTCWFNPEHKVNNKNVNLNYEITNLDEVIDIVL